MRAGQVGTNQHTLRATLTHPSAALQSYRVELPQDLLDEEGSLLDWLIGYAFDTLEARHLDLRIVTVAHSTRREAVEKPSFT